MSKIKEPEARAAYLALGPKRTLAMLHRHVAETAPESIVSLRTLRTWSTANGWVKLAKAHDEDVAKKAAERVAN